MAINQWQQFLRNASKLKGDLMSRFQNKHIFPAVTVLLKAKRVNQNGTIRFESATAIDQFLLKDPRVKAIAMGSIRAAIKQIDSSYELIQVTPENLKKIAEAAEAQKKGKIEIVAKAKGGEVKNDAKPKTD